MVIKIEAISEQDVLEALGEVVDPEIPAVSVIDLGIIESVEVADERAVITCLPTFVGCPAVDAIRQDIEKAVTGLGLEAEVKFVYNPPWTSDRITEEGRRKLTEYGLAPPHRMGSRTGAIPLTLVSSGRCPFCGSSNTVLENPFGPTACRATCYCNACRNPYEQFKPV